MAIRPTILAASAALVLVASGPALAQGAGDPAATSATPARLTLNPSQVVVVGAASFRVGRDLYQVAGVRAPRATLGSCFYERLRGRESRKQLVRIMATGPIVVTPTAATTRRGARLAEVTARGRSVAQTLIARQVALPASAASARNPWCVGGNRPRG
jgi:endonuclease YncB( thermonuclease family)